MKKSFLLCLSVLAALIACTEEESFNKTLPIQVDAHAHAQSHNRNFNTHLNGDQEKPNPIASKAQGQANFKLSKDGTAIYYKLNVANIENVSMAHLHLISNPNGTGGVVVWLYPAAPPAQLIPGRTNGTLAEGMITDANLTGALTGMTLADLIAAIEANQIYVNVHTSQNPPGEIRGDI